MKTVLIAEDNAVNRELLRELLEMRGFAVAEACDGKEALHMVDQVRPAILLLDLSMPKMDGFAVLRRLRENPQTAGLPVLAVTAFAMQGDREKILSSGFDGYLSKPVNFGTLMEEMGRLLGEENAGAQPNNQNKMGQAAGGSCK